MRGAFFPSEDLACRLGVYELQVQHKLKEMLGRGMTFYDVGANVGFHSLLGARRIGNQGHVYAFEPLAQNSKRLCELMRVNHVSNFTLIEAAVSNQVGSTEFFSGPSPAQASLSPSGRNSFSVRTTDLDTFASANRWPDLILMDIEGFEGMALQGATAILSSKRRPAWIVEVHNLNCRNECEELFQTTRHQVEVLMPVVPRKGLYPLHLLARPGISSE